MERKTAGVFTAILAAGVLTTGILAITGCDSGTIRSTETLLNKKLYDGSLTIQKRDIKLKNDDYKITLADKVGNTRLYVESNAEGTNITIKDEKGTYSMITEDNSGEIKEEKVVLNRKFDMGSIEIKLMDIRTRTKFSYKCYEIVLKDDKEKYEITMEVPKWYKHEIKFTDDEGLVYPFES